MSAGCCYHAARSPASPLPRAPAGGQAQPLPGPAPSQVADQSTWLGWPEGQRTSPHGRSPPAAAPAGAREQCLLMTWPAMSQLLQVLACCVGERKPRTRANPGMGGVWAHGWVLGGGPSCWWCCCWVPALWHTGKIGGSEGSVCAAASSSSNSSRHSVESSMICMHYCRAEI